MNLYGTEDEMIRIEPGVKDPLRSTRSLFKPWMPEERQSFRGAGNGARAELACPGVQGRGRR
jgi:hypothetical protein